VEQGETCSTFYMQIQLYVQFHIQSLLNVLLDYLLDILLCFLLKQNRAETEIADTLLAVLQIRAKPAEKSVFTFSGKQYSFGSEFRNIALSEPPSKSRSNQNSGVFLVSCLCLKSMLREKNR